MFRYCFGKLLSNPVKIVDFWHYTSAQCFRSIESGSDYGRCGILPIRRFMPLGTHPDIDEKAHSGASYGFLRPMDRMWCLTRNEAGVPLLESFVQNISVDHAAEIYLLRVTLNQSDDAYVANKSASPSLNHYVSGRERLWDSFIPVGDYKNAGTAYMVSEIVCFSKLPLERIQIAAVLNKHDLVNDIRSIARLPPHPKPADVDHLAILDGLLGIDHPPVAPRKPILSLVTREP